MKVVKNHYTSSAQQVEPQSDWTLGRYRTSYVHLLASGEESKAVRIRQSFLSSDLCNNRNDKADWNAFCEWQKINFTGNGNLDSLTSITESNPKLSYPYYYLAKANEHYGAHKIAAELYQKAIDNSSDISQILSFLEAKARACWAADLKKEFLGLVNEIRLRGVSSSKSEIHKLKSLSELFELSGDRESALAAKERIVELDPTDVDIRFSVAYDHSQYDRIELALYHYLQIPKEERVAATWNNIGAAFDSLNMPAMSVCAYRKAIEDESTLSMSNLALKYLSAGFIEEANLLCTQATQLQDFHENIGNTITSIKSSPQDEDNRLSEIVKNEKPKSHYYRNFGRASSVPSVIQTYTKWESENCELKVSVSGTEIGAVGYYDVYSSALGFILVPGIGQRADRTPEKYVEKYEGEIKGNTVHGCVSRVGLKRVGGLISSGATSENKNKVIMYFNEDKEVLEVLEDIGVPNKPKVYTISVKS